MKITDILATGKRTLSFEVFPPKTSDKFDTVKTATEQVAALRPDYMSVTYGAGGNGSKFTLPIASNIEKNYGVPVIHHLTCVDSSKENIKNQLDYMRAEGIENVLALRGDLPDGANPSVWDFHHANELTAFIKEYGGFCIGGACYPECHPESATIKEDILNLKLKVEAGCEFLTTQLFLDNNTFYDFMDKLSLVGIDIPVTAGIMALTSVRQFNRIVTLSGSVVPAKLARMGAKYADDPESMKKAGIEFASEQIRNLYDNGVQSVHLYTMNNAFVAAEIQNTFREYLA